MKKLLFTVATLFALISCGADKYNVTGSFDNNSFDGKTAYLVNYDTQDTIDSTMIRNKAFSFAGVTEDPIIARLIINDVQGTKALFVLEGGEIAIDTKERYATGTELNDLFVALRKSENAIDEEYEQVEEAFNAGKISKDEYANKGKSLTAKMNEVYKTVYNDNKKNPVGYYAFLTYTYEFNTAQFDSIMADAPESLANMARVQTWLESAKKKEKTAEGKKFTDFVVKSEDGMETKLSDFVGKGDYTLVDFWASWCGPCIKEGEVIKEIYNEYQGKGLNVLGVAVWDDPENTRTAIKKHELPWQQIINAEKIPTDIYGITGIPHIIIFAPDGTIVSRGLQGEKLKDKVRELMNKRK